MKTSAKKKEEAVSGKKTVNKQQVKEKTLSEQEQNIMNLWEHEVQGLLDRQFSDFEEAIEAVIDGVINKIDPKSISREKTRNFLYDFMTTDPEMINELKAIFKLN